MPDTSQIREHMEVIGADGVHLGTVDRVEGERTKLVRAASGMAHPGHPPFTPGALVADVKGDRARLSANGDVAASLFEEEESGQAIG